VYLTQIFLLLIGQQGLADFFRYRALLPLAGGLCKFHANSGGKKTNTMPTTLSAIQAASQSDFINEQLNSPCD
jgi:hypothetical protein